MSDEDARDFVLQYLYEQQRKQPGRGIGYPKIMIMRGGDANADSHAAIAMAVDFLEDEGFIKSQSQQHVKYYRLSAKGQTRILGPSLYSRDRAAGGGAHVTNNGGIVFLGDNYGTVGIEVRTEVSDALHKFIEDVRSASDIEDGAKADLIQSAATIDAQVKTQNPDKTIISRAWKTIDVGTTLATAAGYIAALQPHITHLLHQL